ncbi:MAG: L-threonylcarbamoyladenylate synthase [Gammaproteobacteria bacterium]|nr:L-threonylcarbamoyladenylate synthase [Gammaproteobacteria bacterium]
MSPWALNRFIHAVSQGAVFGYPTDTIWGFGCHPLITAGVNRILQIKNRSPEKGLILLSSRLEYCAAYTGVDTNLLKPIQCNAENPTTWLVPASDFCPPWIRGNHATVAIRITDHPFLRTVCDRLEAPIVSTSANRSGKTCVRNALQMRKQFDDELDFIVTGFDTGGNQPSEIKSLDCGITLRSNH